MIYAQIKDGKVKNTIVIDDVSLLHLFTEGFDYCLKIDDVEPQPGVGWGYDEGSDSYTLPPPPPNTL